MPDGQPAPAPRRRLRRTWPQRLLIGMNVALIAACLVVASGLGYFYNKYTQIERIAVGQQLSEESEAPGNPENWLLVGSDTRAGIDPNAPDAGGFGGEEDAPGQRSDTIMILRVDPADGQARLLSIPRDLFVTMAGTGRDDRINSAYAEGADRLIATIRQNLDIPIHHYVEVDFVAFKSIVDAIGGVPVPFAAPARDRNTGLFVEADEFPACVMLDGQSALAFARSRHYEALVDGDWEDDPTADIGRIQRQQDFVKRSLQRAVARGARNIATANRLIDVVVDGRNGLKLDDTLSVGDLQRMARHFTSFDPAALETHQLPTTPTTLRGMAVLLLDEEAAQPVLDRFRDEPVIVGGGTTPPDLSLVDPATVAVTVLNGSGEAGAAGAATDALAEVGFLTGTPADADRATYTTDVVLYPEGADAEAALLAAHLRAGARLEPADDPDQDGLVLVLGSAHRGVRSEAAPAPPAVGEEPVEAAPTTTAPPSTLPREFLPPSDVPCG